MKFCTRSRGVRLGDCRGQSLVEFALCALVLIGLVFGVVDMCRMVLAYTTIVNVARMGTRYAIVNPASPSQLHKKFDDYLKAGTVNAANTTITVNPGVPNVCASPGCPVSVTVSYLYDPLPTYFHLPAITLSSTSEGVITW